MSPGPGNKPGLWTGCRHYRPSPPKHPLFLLSLSNLSFSPEPSHFCSHSVFRSSSVSSLPFLSFLSLSLPMAIAVSSPCISRTFSLSLSFSLLHPFALTALSYPPGFSLSFLRQRGRAKRGLGREKDKGLETVRELGGMGFLGNKARI